MTVTRINEQDRFCGRSNNYSKKQTIPAVSLSSAKPVGRDSGIQRSKNPGYIDKLSGREVGRTTGKVRASFRGRVSSFINYLPLLRQLSIRLSLRGPGKVSEFHSTNFPCENHAPTATERGFSIIEQRWRRYLIIFELILTNFKNAIKIISIQVTLNQTIT